MTDHTSPRDQWLMPISVLFCSLILVGHFANTKTFELFDTVLSKRTLIIPVTFLLAGFVLRAYKLERAHRLVAFGVYTHITAAVISQFMLINTDMIKTAWFIPLALSLTTLLSQHINLYILNNASGVLKNFSLTNTTLFGLAVASFLDLAMSVVLIPHQATALKATPVFFLYSLLVAIVIGGIGLFVLSFFPKHFNQDEATHEGSSHDPVFSWKVFVAKEPGLPKEAKHVEFLTDRE